ncbi:hypothetical protein D3C84_903450 [compost metagenome]
MLISGCSASSPSSASGSLCAGLPTTSSAPPAHSGPSISSREISKAGVVINSQRVALPSCNRRLAALRKLARERRLITTPLGRPVEPEVNII